VACVAKPDTILGWYRKLIAEKFDSSKQRRYPGRPPIEPKLEALIVKMARENSGWGYDRIVGARSNLGYTISRPAGTETEPNHDVEGIHSIASGCVGWDRLLHGGSPHLAWPGDVLHIVLHSSGEPPRQLGRDYEVPRPTWMQQMARNATGESLGFLDKRRYVLHDRDTKFCSVFRGHRSEKSDLHPLGISYLRLVRTAPDGPKRFRFPLYFWT
jgi:putative transposase